MINILVATDLSERADRAVKRAFRLAKALDATCHILTVIDDALPGDLAERLRRDSLSRLKDYVAACQPQPGKIEIRSEIGDPLSAIPQYAEDLDAALVLLGQHRPRPILDILRETTMERLVRLLRRPVLLVRQLPVTEYRRVLAPVNFSPACAAALRAARMVAPTAEFRPIHGIHLPFAGLTGEGPNGEMAQQIKREAEAESAIWADLNDLPADLAAVLMVKASVFQLIDAEMRNFKPDLITLGAHTRHGLSPYTLGSFAAYLIRNPPTDLLIVRPAIARSVRIG